MCFSEHLLYANTRCVALQTLVNMLAAKRYAFFANAYTPWYDLSRSFVGAREWLAAPATRPFRRIFVLLQVPAKCAPALASNCYLVVSLRRRYGRTILRSFSNESHGSNLRFP